MDELLTKSETQVTWYLPGDETKPHKIQDTDELYLMCRRLEMMMVVLLLQEIGIGYDLLATAMARCPRYRDLAADKDSNAISD